MEEIERLWSEFESTPLPRGYKGEGELAELEVDLFEANTFAAGCIITFILNKGQLDARRIFVLKNCVKKLNKLKYLFDERNPQQKAYAIQLLVLSKKVLEASK